MGGCGGVFDHYKEDRVSQKWQGLSLEGGAQPEMDV